MIARAGLSYAVIPSVLGVICAACAPLPCGPHVADAARAELAALRAMAAPLDDTPDAGLAAMTDWAALPTFQDWRYRQFSSHNRTPGRSVFEPGGKDFNNFITRSARPQFLFLEQLDGPDPDEESLDGYVLASLDDGPGFVSRLFFTRFEGHKVLGGTASVLAAGDLGQFGHEVLRVYADDLTTPALVIPLDDLGVTAPFEHPFAGPGRNAVLSYLPLGYNERLRVVLSGLCPLNGYYYHVGVQQTGTPTRRATPRLNEDPDYATTATLLRSFGDNPVPGGTAPLDDVLVTLPAGETTLLMTDSSSGVITMLRLAFDAISSAELRALQLQVTYDGASAPAIDVPLDAFFGCREARAPFRTLAMKVQVDGDALDAACFLPIPYAEGVRIEVQNTGPAAVALRASLAVDRTLPVDPWGYLHARSFAVAGRQPRGSQFRVLRVSGRGRYVGTFLFAAGTSDWSTGLLAAALNILEGNELGLIDGEPRIFGTGTEDYYNGGFYFTDGPFDHPFAATNAVSRFPYRDPGIVSCCRWHVLADAIDFQESFELRFQYGADNPALVERYATVAYYYLDRPEPGDATGGNWAPPPSESP